MNRLRSCLTAALLLSVSIAAAWDARNPGGDGGAASASSGVRATIDAFLNKDPSLQAFFDKAYGFVVFPGVGKGGFGIGGAYGKGEVFEQGKLIGYSSLKQLTIGFQLGGQKYSEIIFFRTKAALDDFTRGNFEFSAQASAVAVTAGASADADYHHDVAVFTMARGGLMYEASVGGQKFSYRPK